MTEPSVGRIVHYVSYGTPGGEYESACRAAVITEVHDEVHVGLCVLNPSGVFFHAAVHHDEGSTVAYEQGVRKLMRAPAGGTWHWPERTS